MSDYVAGGQTRHVGDVHMDGVEPLYDGGPERSLGHCSVLHVLVPR